MKGKGWVGGCQEGLPAEVIMMLELIPYELKKLCKGSSEHGGGGKKKSVENSMVWNKVLQWFLRASESPRRSGVGPKHCIFDSLGG